MTRGLVLRVAAVIAVPLFIFHALDYRSEPPPATAMAECRQANRLLAGHLSRQTEMLIARDTEIRRLRADLARRRALERAL